MATISAVNNGDTGLQARTKINTNDTNINNAVIALEGRFLSQIITLVADTDLPIPNPYTLPIIPRIVDVKSLNILTNKAVNIIGLFKEVDQVTGDIVINSGSDFDNAILTIIGW